MDFVKGLFARDYQTALEIETMTVNDILQIPPDKISTTKIIADDLFKNIHPEKQAAVKYIAEQKYLRDEYSIPYPLPNKIVDMFQKRKSNERAVQDLINTQGFKDLDEREAARKTFEGLAPTPGATKKGGKKRSRKQKRRKTRRNKML